MRFFKRKFLTVVLSSVLLLVCLPPVSSAAVYPLLPRTAVVIDAGHGGIDGGAVYGDLLEKDINLEIAKKLYKDLNSRHVPVVLNRKGDYALSDDNLWLRIRSRHKRDLAQRTQLANELNPVLLISVHINTSRDRSKSGPLVLHQKNEQSKLAGVIVQQALNRLYGTSELPVYGKTYYILNHSTSPAIIAELGYLTNADDRKRLTDPKQQKKIASTLATAIEEYLRMAGAIAE